MEKNSLCAEKTHLCGELSSFVGPHVKNCTNDGFPVVRKLFTCPLASRDLFHLFHPFKRLLLTISPLINASSFDHGICSDQLLLIKPCGLDLYIFACSSVFLRSFGFCSLSAV